MTYYRRSSITSCASSRRSSLASNVSASANDDDDDHTMYMQRQHTTPVVRIEMEQNQVHDLDRRTEEELAASWYSLDEYNARCTAPDTMPSSHGTTTRTLDNHGSSSSSSSLSSSSSHHRDSQSFSRHEDREADDMVIGFRGPIPAIRRTPGMKTVSVEQLFRSSVTCHNITRRRAIDAVRKEQRRQSREGIRDDELLATIYQGYTITSVSTARRRAESQARSAAAAADRTMYS